MTRVARFSIGGFLCTLPCIDCSGDSGQPHRNGVGGFSPTGGAAPIQGTGGTTSTGGTQPNPGGSSNLQSTASSIPVGGNSALGSTAGGASTSSGTTSGSVVTTGGTPTGGNTSLAVTTGGTASGTTSRGGSASGGIATGGTSMSSTSNRGGASTGGTNSSTTTTGGTSLGGSSHTGKWKVIPVGDSITATTCYPNLTAQKLTSTGHSNFQFVGSVLNNQACSGAANVQTEGHSNMLVTNMTGDFATWANAAKADIALIHFATNDVWNNVSPTNILTAHSKLVDALRAAVPSVIVFVAQIIPMAPSSCGECGARVEALNQQIPGWANGKSTAVSPIYVVDLWTGMTMSSDSADGVHPNVTGAGKMADKMSAAIISKNLF